MTKPEIINHGYSYHDVLPRCTYEDTGIHNFRIELDGDFHSLVCNGCGLDYNQIDLQVEQINHLIMFYLNGVEIHRETLAHIDNTPQGKIADWLGIQRVVVY